MVYSFRIGKGVTAYSLDSTKYPQVSLIFHRLRAKGVLEYTPPLAGAGNRNEKYSYLDRRGRSTPITPFLS